MAKPPARRAGMSGGQDGNAVAPDKDREGHPGFSIADVSASTNGWMASATPPYILVMIGTNDVAWWCAKSASRVADQAAALIDQNVRRAHRGRSPRRRSPDPGRRG
ncbi:MAG: hypothetical protein ABI193_00135 [Minicystis sp.]